MVALVTSSGGPYRSKLPSSPPRPLKSKTRRFALLVVPQVVALGCFDIAHETVVGYLAVASFTVGALIVLAWLGFFFYGMIKF